MAIRTISVVGMFTEELAEQVKTAIQQTLEAAVQNVEVNCQEQTVTVSYDEHKIAVDDIKDAIIVNGFMPEP